MLPNLPHYEPPSDQRASVAAGAAPILVLLTFTLIVTQLIDPDTGFAVFAALTTWVVWETHAYQKSIDGYNEAYVESHLAWRSTPTLTSFVEEERSHRPTRDFVSRFLQAGRELLRDGQSA